MKVDEEIKTLKAKNIFSKQNLTDYSQQQANNDQQEITKVLNGIQQQKVQKINIQASTKQLNPPQLLIPLQQNQLTPKSQHKSLNSLHNTKDVSNSSKKFETPEEYKLLHYQRYLTKLTLQSCAIKSQLEKHDDALIGAKFALKTCIKVFCQSHQMCKNEIEKTIGQVAGISQSNQQNLDSSDVKKFKAKSMLNNGIKGSKIEGNPNTERCRSKTPNKSSQSKGTNKKQSLEKFQNRRQSYDPKNKNNLQFRKSAQMTYSPEPSSSGKKQKLRLQQKRNSVSPKSPNSPDSQKNQYKTLIQQKPEIVKKIGSRKSSVKSTLKFHMSGSEDEQSLERIHTFNLKNDLRAQGPLLMAKKNDNLLSNFDEENDKISPQKIKQLMLYKELGPALMKISDEKQINNQLNSPVSNDLLMTSISTRDQFTSPKMRERMLTADGKSNKKLLIGNNYYVEEQTRALDYFMIDSFNILKSLINRLNHFLIHTSLVQNINSTEFQELVNLEEFTNEGKKISRTNLLKKLKVVKNFINNQQIELLRKSEKYKYAGRNVLGVRQIEDWIHSLEIGHVMQLNPMTAQEMTQNITKHHEFQKDPMLEKLVLLVVAFFSIGTEMRLIVDEDKSKELFKQSELWHAQSVFFGSYFIPSSCPLVTHVINSYFKHYVEGLDLSHLQKEQAQISQSSSDHTSEQKSKLQDKNHKSKKTKANLQKYLIKEMKGSKEGQVKNMSPKSKKLMGSLSNERRNSSQGLRVKRDNSQKDTGRKKSKSKLAIKIKKSKERSKSPTSYTVSQENKMILKKVPISPSKKAKVLSTNNSKINLLKGFLSNTLQKDQQQAANSKSNIKKSNMFETTLQKQPSQNFQQDIININLPINIDSMSSRYDTQSSIPSINFQQYQLLSPKVDAAQTCKNNQSRHFIFIPDEISDIESNRERVSLGPKLGSQFQSQKRISLCQQQLSQKPTAFIGSPTNMIDYTQRRQSLNLSQKKLLINKLNLTRQKTPSRNGTQRQTNTVNCAVSSQAASQTFSSQQQQLLTQYKGGNSTSNNNLLYKSISEALEKQKLNQQVRTVSRQSVNLNHQQQQSRFISTQDTLLSRQSEMYGSTERLQNSKTCSNQQILLQSQQLLQSPQNQTQIHHNMQFMYNTLGNHGTILPPKSNHKIKQTKNNSNQKQKLNGNISRQQPYADTVKRTMQSYQSQTQLNIASGGNSVKLDLKKYLNI